MGYGITGSKYGHEARRRNTENIFLIYGFSCRPLLRFEVKFWNRKRRDFINSFVNSTLKTYNMADFLDSEAEESEVV